MNGRQRDICECRVAFATENCNFSYKKNEIETKSINFLIFFFVKNDFKIWIFLPIVHLLLLLDYDKETNSLNKSDETKTLELIIICFGEAKVDG